MMMGIDEPIKKFDQNLSLNKSSPNTLFTNINLILINLPTVS